MDKYNHNVPQKHHHSSGVEIFCSQMHTDQCRLKTEWSKSNNTERSHQINDNPLWNPEVHPINYYVSTS